MELRNPVVLVHGIIDTEAVFKKMSAYLTERGWSVHRVNLTPNNGRESLEKLAQQVEDYIAVNFAPQQPIDIVGFSMGGLVTRYYLQRLGGIERVQRYISISAPNHGTLMANALPFSGIVQMRPQSDFLLDLNRDVVPLLGKLNFTWIWTPFDLMIVPAQSSRLSVGKELQIPVLVHAWMLKDKRVIKAVADALSEDLPTNKEDFLHN